MMVVGRNNRRVPMTHLPVKRELQPLVMRTGRNRAAAENAGSRFLTVIKDPDLSVVVIFALVGLLVTMVLTMLLPLSAASAVLFAELA
jgi:hypothetical protein